jgi:hypothetical protein
MEWVAVVAVSVGVGVMAGWIYGGLPSLRRFQVLVRGGEQATGAPASNRSDPPTGSKPYLAPTELLPVMERRTT